MTFPRESCAARLRDGIAAVSLAIPDEAQATLLDYLELMAKWNQAYNLTAIRDPLEMVDKHLLDSLSLLPHVAEAPLLDVGAGAGLPGLVLAIVKPGLEVTTVDAVAKKVRFMEHAIRTLRLNHARALHARIESIDGQYHQITSRAFASLADFLNLTRHLLAPGGRWLAMKGQIPHDELSALPAWAEVVETPRLNAPAVLGERHLIILRDKETS
ncbi:MAG TPA: 16S rRNA (guanine(527)-N(7))-methyltransferase RsmG [Chromatiales bacterium]|nr:16S rRNA (guanine(527)-N(7))-methyltransferase RsmG [Chromatiales bacterium]